MAGANNVDMETHSRVKEPLPEEKKKDLLMIQAGGLWTGCSLAKAGDHDSHESQDVQCVPYFPEDLFPLFHS